LLPLPGRLLLSTSVFSPQNTNIPIPWFGELFSDLWVSDQPPVANGIPLPRAAHLTIRVNLIRDPCSLPFTCQPNVGRQKLDLSHSSAVLASTTACSELPLATAAECSLRNWPHLGQTPTAAIFLPSAILLLMWQHFGVQI
jgi:hypothetical protein